MLYFQIFTQIIDVTQNNCTSNILNDLNILLQYCIDLLVCLQKAIQIIDKKVNIECVKSLPITTCDVLHLIFKHCKERYLLETKL